VVVCFLKEYQEDSVMRELIKEVQKEFLRTDIPDFKAGDTIDVFVKISEGTKDRIQKFQGIVIQRRGEGGTEMVTVRKISHAGVGVERIFPIHSPAIEKFEVVKRGKVRRARIFYLRNLKGKAARIKET